MDKRKKNVNVGDARRGRRGEERERGRESDLRVVVESWRQSEAREGG